MKKLIFQCLFISISYTVFCQYPEIHLERIAEQQGLNDLWINCFLQDHKGFIWIGGENGLYRFDGYNLVYLKDPPGCPGCPHFYPVFDIVEDNHGFIWTITSKGIIIYDPEKESSRIAYSFVGSNVEESSFFFSKQLDLLYDSHFNIWATNDKGLIRISYRDYGDDRQIDPERKRESIFQTDFFYLPGIADSATSPVQKIIEDQSGNIWAICVDALYVKRNGDSSFYRLEIAPEMRTASITSDRDILEQNEDTLIIIADRAVYQMSNVEKSLEGSKPDGSIIRYKKLLLPDDQLPSTLYKDRKNNILIGTDLDVYQYNPSNKETGPAFKSLYKMMFDKKDYQGGKGVKRIFQDRSGIMWVGHENFGILKFNPYDSPFINYNNLENSSLINFNVNNILFDAKGNLWIAEWGGGLYRFQEMTNQLIRYDLGVIGNRIVCIEETDPGIFWLGLSDQGVLEYNTLTGKFHDPLPQGDISSDIRASQINNILKDKEQIYLTTPYGIYVYDLSKNKIAHFLFPDSKLIRTKTNWTISPVKLKTGEIIAVAKSYGIVEINYDSEKVKLSATCLISDSVLLKSNIDLTYTSLLYQDSNGSLWMCEKDGLHRINIENREIDNFKTFKNIEFPEAWSIIEDNHNNLWIGTHFGLCRFNTSTGQSKFFEKEDGLPISSHQYNSVCKDSDGRLYFGGVGGFYSFHPDSVKTNTCVPPVVITDLRLFNKSVGADSSKKAILTKNISYSSHIELQHNQNDLSFEFTSLDFTIPSRNKYAYKLEGYQDEWIETDAQKRVATYTNLYPGTYIFHVTGSNNDGVWNGKGASLTIVIHKPWWGTTMALGIYLLIFLSAILAIIRWRLRRLRKEKLELEKQVHERTRQVEEQKDQLKQQNQQIKEQEQLKSRFFTNVSHEFRTPLSLIQSPVEELLDDPHRNEKDRRKLYMVRRNAHRLLNLVNQLLDISKLDGSNIKLELIHADVLMHLRAITGAFTSMAETKRINYQRHFPDEEKVCWFDPDKLEKIAGNILSNAFKFTHEGGEIIFTATYTKNNGNQTDYNLEFTVRDNGPGIPSDSLEKIFDRFYQVEESVKTEGGGTGIGLSLARDMARLMHGDISVQSEPRSGCIFTVIIPLGKDHLNESEFILLKEAPENEFSRIQLHENPEEIVLQQEVMPKNERPIILIVEDNRDIRLQLADNFNHQYTIQEAINGKDGLIKATEIIPDLIITDLMMPLMDGVELCDKLKNDERTSHIPIIMLTAKVTLEDKITGLINGADDYISKPFQMAELKARVANLIEQRRKLRERFSRELTLKPSDISITPVDEKFLNKAMGVVEKHMHNESFDLRIFREEMNMSKSTLFRKLHALTNQSPSEFIRTIRLKRSASLLEQDYGNVTQVSYAVGFNNLSYFNRSFKKLFGISPVIYLKSHRVKKEEISSSNN